MNVRMPDGSYVHIPDEWTTDQKYFFLKGKLQPPSIGERVKGALGAGVASTIETAANIRELIPGHAAAAADMRRAASELRGADYIRRIEMAQPESTLGKVGQGLVEFIPQMPLYMGGEAAALGAAKTIPALRGAVTALEAVPGASAFKEIPKSAARAAVGGMTVGALGAPSGSGVVGSIKHGAEEAVAFAGAVTAFGTLFRLLGASGRALLRINRSAIEGLKPEQQADLVDRVRQAPKEERATVLEEELKSTKAYSPWESLYRDEYERQAEAESPWAALAQQRDELRNLSRNSEEAADALKKTEEVVDWAKRQEEMGSRNQATIRRMREKIRAQQEENAKILPQEVKPNDQTDLTGMGSAERVGEEARRSVQDASLGEEAPRTSGDVQAYEGKEGLSLLEQYKLAKEAEGFDDFDWFEQQGLGERWELHKRGYGIEEVLKMSEEDALKKLLTRPEPAMPSPDDLLSWQNRQAGMVASQVARRKAGATVKAENRPEDYAARKKLKERVAKLEAERKADLAMIDDIIKADKASPRSIDDAVAATVRIISKEDNPELFAQIAQAYTPQAIERMQNKSEFESWRRKGEAKDRPYNLTRPGREQAVQKEGESVEAIAAQEQGARFEGEEEMDIHRRRGVTLSFLGTGEVEEKFRGFRTAVPRHGTDIDKLESVLKNGLRAGSAIDATKEGGWLADYPIIVEVPGAKLGKYIEHNKYHISDNVAKPTKVIVDFTQYVGPYGEAVKSRIDALQKQFPRIKFVLRGYEPYTPKYSAEDVVKLANELSTLWDMNRDRIEAIRAKIDNARAPYKRQLSSGREYYYNVPEKVNKEVAEWEKGIKFLERQRDSAIRRVERRLEEAEADLDFSAGTTLSFLGTGELDKWFGDFRDSVRTKMETSPLLKKPLRDVRTLKNIRDFIEPNKYDVPPAAAKLVEDISGEEAKLYDMTEKRGADIMKASEWLVPTVRLFEKHPGAARAATEIVMADQTVGYNQGIHFSVLRDAVAGLTQKERGMLKAVIEEKKSAPEHVVAAARKLTEWLTLMKGRYQTYLDEMFKAHLMPEQYEAVRKVANGADLDVTAKAAKMKPKLLKSLVDKWNSVEKWGLDPETYVPHVERGAIKLMVKTDKGKFKTVAVALSKDHAVEKARELIASGQKELYMDTTIPESLKDLPEPMRPMQYFRVATKLRKAIAEDLVDLNKELKAKQVLRGVMEVRPTKKFTPFEKPRHDVLAGEEDIVPVLYAYAHSMEAKMQMDPVIDKVQDLVPHLPANMRNAMINLVDEVKGKHWTSDQIAEEIFRKAGWETKPRPFSRFVSHVKMAEALFKFAYRPVALAVNAASAAGHIWTKTGTKYLTEGFRFMRTEEGKRLLDSVRHLLGTDQVTEMSGKTHGKLHLWHPLGMFQMPEKPMRELALCANYLLARDKGLIGSEAIEFAVRANWMQNFIYNTAALPKALRSPMGRLLGQFKPYLIQEVNFISQLRGAEAVRYLAVMATLGGPIGYMATLKTLPILSMFPWWGEVEDYVNTNFPRLSRGVPGLLGVDISAPATFQFPTKWEDWAGPFVSDLLKIKREVLDPVTRGEILDAPEAMRKVAGETIPIMRHWNEFIDQVIDKDGWVKDERGRRIYHVGESPLDMAKYAFKLAAGAKDLERSVIQKHESFLKEQERVRTRNKQTVVDEILDAVEHGEPVTAKMLNAMTEFNINTASLRRAAKFRQLDAQTRRYILTEVAKRPEVLEGWPQLE